MMKVFTGNANITLAQGIADYLKEPLGEAEVSRFPDGEISVKIGENVRGKDVFIVQPTCPPANENLMELLIMVDALRRASASRITCVVPFYGYGRQDRKDQPRAPITAKLVANLMVASGASRLLTMDLHAQQIMGFFDIPVDHLFAAPVLGKHLIDEDIEDPVMVSPDVGGIRMAYAYSQMLGSGLAVIAKQRKGPSEVETLTIVGEVEGKTAIMADDFSTTAGTLVNGAKLLRERGAKEVRAVISHAPIVELGMERLRGSKLTELITTDSVPVEVPEDVSITVLSVAGLLGEAIMRIHEGRSVSSLLNV